MTLENLSSLQSTNVLQVHEYKAKYEGKDEKLHQRFKKKNNK